MLCQVEVTLAQSKSAAEAVVVLDEEMFRGGHGGLYVVELLGDVEECADGPGHGSGRGGRSGTHRDALSGGAADGR